MDDAPKCQVYPSKIHKRGLFAVFPIRKNEIVVNYNIPEIWCEKPFSELTEKEIRDCWWIGITKEVCAIPTKQIKFFMANHSNYPNCLWLREEKKLIAVKDIDIGEEITYNYNLEIKPDNWIKFKWISQEKQI